ncbi:hypothetical protein [Streptomyces graminilatus]|uniref:hypothetical protein n=1 Tax=Streptomyces graminilatus TaxID=1464070 RepID=UPI0007C6DB05|nr:hypothetical protein [Streptomyces graminilatus]
MADVPGAYEVLESAVQAGTLKLLYTHVNIDELAEVPDLDRRSTLLLLLVSLSELVPTGATALDYSRLNFCRVSDESDDFEIMRSQSIKHTRDALIASTARFEQCALVTNEHRLAKRSRERGIEVLTSADLLAEFGFTLPVVPKPSAPTVPTTT